MERLVGQSLGRYRIISLLGEGGMGAVFKARDVTLQRDVAIKIMHPHLSSQPSFRERFLQEARTAARLDHPGIVQVYDFGQEQGFLFIVMKFIRGANLRQMLQELKAQGKWIPLDEAVLIVRHVAEAMDYTHRHGVLHRDLKPSNIMIEPEPAEGLPYRPVLTDLGLARLMEGQHITRAGTSLGTPTYMSPEQALGQETDARSDIYSLGVILYELATGRPPFPIRTITEAIRYHTKETPKPPSEIRPDIPPRLEQVILKALSKNPSQRWESAGAMAQALATLASEVSETASPTAVATSVSLLTQYQQSLKAPRGPSVLREFTTPVGPGDTVQARLPDGTAVEAKFTGQSMTLGRADDNDLTLKSSNVSRYHARIEFDGQHYQVVDLDSTNGTYIGDAKLLPGVPEIWAPGQPLRVGDVWLRLVRATAQPSMPAGRPGLTAAGRTAFDPNLVRSSAGEGRIGVVMEETQLTVAPGERTVVSLVLLNQGAIVDHFSVSVEGIPKEWTELPPVVQLMPGEQREVTFVLHPPRSPKSRAGRYTVTIKVTSRDAPSQSVEVRAALTITPYSTFRSQIHPQKIKAGQSTQVTVYNEGNFPETYTVKGSDRANEVVFEPPMAHVKVPQGKAGSVALRAKPVKRALIGRTRSLPFTITVEPTQGSPQQHAGELVSRALIPTWVPPLAIGLLMVLCALLVLLMTRPPVIEMAEVIPPNPVAGEPVTIRWRVTNARRVELRPFGIEVDPAQGEYTFPEGFDETTTLSLVAANTFRTTRESLTIQITTPEVVPVINEFTVFPTEITLGQEVTIRWSVSNAESVKLQPFGNVDPSGERKDSPVQTQTYTLIAINQGQSVEKSERVVVSTPAPDAPQVVNFSVEPATVVEGIDTTVLLSWETQQADTVTIEPGLGAVGLAGSREVPAPTSDTVYTLVARGPGGEVTAQVQVYVEPQRCLAATDGLRLREGPGTVYDPPIRSLAAGTELRPIAYSSVGYPDGEWVKVEVIDTGEEGWVAREYLTDCNVNIDGLGSAPFPPTPLPPFEVTAVQVSVTPSSYSGVCPKQFSFSAQITANGAGTVTYRWERSDNATPSEESVSFGGSGTKTVNTSWTLSSDGTYWERLHILSPNDMVSNQATFTLDCQIPTAYIYSTDINTANSFKALLQNNGYTVDLVKQNAIMSTNFDKYRLVLIGPETGSGFSWGDAGGSQAERIKDSGASIVGIGTGGASFMDQIGQPIGWGDSWTGSGARDIYVHDPDDSVWSKPFEITIPSSRVLTLYTANSPFVAVYLPGPVSGIKPIGRQSDNATHYPIISKDGHYLLWGFNRPPSAMTETGQRLFVNAANSILGIRFLLIRTLIFQPVLPSP